MVVAAEADHLPPADIRNKLREMVYHFVTGQEFQRFVAQAEDTPNAFPREFLQSLVPYGFLGMDIPNEPYGGSPLSPLEAAAVMEELSWGSPGLALSVLVQNSLTAFPIARFGSKAQKDTYLSRMANGELFACFGLTEPDIGSDAKGIKLRATWNKEQQGWVIHGSKRFITGAIGSGIIVLAARTGSEKSREHGITTFIAEIAPGTKGVTVAKPFEKLGQPGSPLSEIFFDNFFVPADAVLGELNGGWNVLEATLAHSRTWIAAQGAGISRRAWDEAYNYANEREQFGRKLIEIPDISEHLGVLGRQVRLSQYLVEKAAQHEQEGVPDAFVWASLAKLIACESALWATGEAMLLHGGMGYMCEVPISRFFRDAPVLRIYEGAAHILKKILDRNGITRSMRLLLYPPSAALERTVGELISADRLIAAIETWRTGRVAEVFAWLLLVSSYVRSLSVPILRMISDRLHLKNHRD